MTRFRLAALLSLLLWGASSDLGAQATGTTTFNAPYRAFTRSEFGVLVSFPNGGGTAFEGQYRVASGRLDIGFKGGVLDASGAGDAVLLLGAEARARVLNHNQDFPLDGAVVFGAGANLVSGNSILILPLGLSLGRRIATESGVSIVPYVQPSLFILAGDTPNHTQFALGLGIDFRFTPRFDARLSAGLGDVEGVSLGAVWVH
jgi:hypothetical protein